MKKLKHLCTVAAAFGLAAQVQAGYFAGSTDFEGTSPLEDGLWSAAGDAEVKTDTSVESASRPANLPFTSATRSKVLVIDNDEPIVRSLGQNDGTASGNIYADVLVKGTALAYGAVAPTNSLGSTDKLLVYFRVNESGNATNVCVFAKAASNSESGEEFVLTQPGVSIGKDTWHRIVIAATDGGAYQLYLDGHDSANLCKTAGDKDTFYSLSSTTAVSGIGFKGTGSVDDLVLSTFTPALPVTTLSWDTSLASVSYTVNGEAGDALTPSAGSYKCQIPTGATVIMTGSNGFRSFSSTGTTLEVPTGLAYYTDGDGTQANPYEIPTFEALVAMKEAVAGGTGNYRSAYYVQTADIDGTGKAAFAGIGTYAKVPTAGVPFTGTYDGQGHTIANITRAGENTQGIFNQVGPSGVIENLVVSNMVFASDVSGEYGFAIVGNAGGGATLRNLTAAGVFGSAEKPSTHNMAGIVVRLSPGATAGDATTIDSCTNNATIYGGYTKLGGINAIVQNQTGFQNGKVVFVNCANNGTLVCKRTAAQAAQQDGAVTGNAGIVGYFSGTNVELTGCYSNGNITNADGANTDKDGALVGWTYGGTIKDNGGNSAPSNKKMIGTWGGATETGFQYATVSGDIATTIAPPYTLAKDTIYLLEGNATPSFELAAAGDTIAFDEALTYTLTGSGITAATGLTVSSNKVGSVTTFSAAVTQYTISWDTDGDGNVDDTTTVAYNSTPTHADGEKTSAEYAYTFTGWSPEVVAATADATYTAQFNETSLAAMTWVGSASGDWDEPSNWDIGYVPTTATVVTFTNDATVAIYRDQDDCKKLVLDGADVSLVRAEKGTYDGDVHLLFSGDNGSAVSGTGTLSVEAVGIFNRNTSGVLTIDTDLAIADYTKFRGNRNGNSGQAASFTVNGDTSVADDTTVWTIDYATTTFSGDISVPANASVKFRTHPNGQFVIDSNSTVTLATDLGTGATLELDDTGTGGRITVNGSIVTDDPAYAVNRSGRTYTVALKTFTVTFSWHGGSSEATYDYGTAKANVTVPADPAEYVDNGTIYTFTGWSAEVPDTITNNVAITAQYSSTAAKATVMTVADAGATTNYTYFATVTAALEAAQTGDTVVVLADTCERVYATVTNDVTLDINGATMTSPVDDVIVKNGSGTLTIVDTAVTPGLVQSTINGVDLGVAVWVRQGTVVIESGVFENNSNYEATLYVSNGAYAEVNGGTFRNVAEGTYHWNTAWDPINLNIQNGHADKANAIVVNGGSFSTDPQLGDDSLHGDGDFTDDGYVALDDGNGNFVVQPGYNVTFDANGGAPAPEAQRVAAGGTATAPATAPVKAGYTFNGWTLGGAAFDFDTVLDDDITLVAAFDSAVATVMTIADAGATTNYTDYATLAAAVDAAQTGDTVVLLANVNEAIVNTANKNFTIDLNGQTWSSDSDVLATSAGTITIEATNGGEMTTEAVECCAVWAKGGDVVINGGTFTSKDNKEATIYVSNANSVITINGGTFENTDTRPYAYGASLQALTLNVKNDLEGQHIIINGGTFIGNDPQLGDDTAGGTSAQSDVKFVSDGFVAIDDGNGNFVVQPGYNVTFDANGGSPVPEAQRVAAGGTATEPAEPTKEGYTFDGWFADGASVPFDFDTVLDDDIELVAAWSEAQHETPHVDVGGGLAAWNAEHPGNAVDPVKIDGEGFKASFIAPAEGYYYLMTASTPASSDEAYTADLGTEYYVGASDVGKPVTLVDDDMSATSKFYKIGYSAEAIDAGN